jgi:acyl dehydratase
MNRLLTPELKALVGTEAVYSTDEPLGRASIRYFARAVGDDNPLYTDAATARGAGYADVIAPPTLVCETNQYIDRRRDSDGYVGHLWDIDVPGTRLIRGGNEYEFHQPVYPSDCITAHWRIADMTERSSSRGAMLFVISEVRFTNQHGELLAVNRETNIYQELEGGD